jgi:hypothetical protein
MSDRKNIGSVSYHNDDETGMNYIGEPDGGFDRSKLTDYLKQFGARGQVELLAHLGHMSFQVIDTWRSIQTTNTDAKTASIGDKN